MKSFKFVLGEDKIRKCSNCNIVNILQLITIIKQYLSYNYDYDFKVIYEYLISCLIYKYNTRYKQISKNWWEMFSHINFWPSWIKLEPISSIVTTTPEHMPLYLREYFFDARFPLTI